MNIKSLCLQNVKKKVKISLKLIDSAMFVEIKFLKLLTKLGMLLKMGCSWSCWGCYVEDDKSWDAVREAHL